MQQVYPQAPAPGGWPARHDSVAVSLFLVRQCLDPWREEGSGASLETAGKCDSDPHCVLLLSRDKPTEQTKYV